jgi:DNA sulfur modification protein DndD
MKINIAGWSSEGLRCPDVEIDVRDASGEPYPVTLLQMPNGTGKTTTLELLKATLSGEGGEWDDAKVREFRRKDATNSNGSFKVKLLVDEQPVTFELELDFENGRVRCLTTRPGSGGVVRGWKPPQAIRRFVDASFLNLFIFNGELANELFQGDKTRADDAIDALCQLYLIEEANAFVEANWQKVVSNATGPKSDSSLATLRKRVEELKARRVKVRRMRVLAVTEMAEAKKASEDLEAKIKAKTTGKEKDKAAHAAAKVDEATANGEVVQAREQLLLALRNPLSFGPAIGERLTEWKDHLDVLKLPEPTSAAFFTDLLRQTECICGTTMTDAMRTQIENQSKRVLSSSENGAMNIIKDAIDDIHRGEGPKIFHETIVKRLQGLSEARRKQLEASQNVRLLWQKIIGAGGPEVEQWEKDQEGHDAKYAQAEEELIRSIDAPALSSKEDGLIFSIARLDREIDDNEKKISDATDTVETRQKKTIIDRIVRRAEEIARRAIKTELLSACNERLKVILADDPVQLESIDGHLRLEGQSKASEAQTLSVGYTFLMTLLERGDNRFPLMVDSPVGKMDGTTRRAVGRLVPSLCGQFLTFVINTEKPYFVPALEKAAHRLQYLTFFRKTPGTERLMGGLPSSATTQTNDGVLVSDLAYFNSFDIEEEDD